MTVLVLTNKRDLSADEVIRHIEALGGSAFRLNTEDFCEGIAVTLRADSHLFDCEFRTASRGITLEQIKSVFSRRPTPPRHVSVQPRSPENFVLREREAFLTWLWIALRDRYWLNHPGNIHFAESKLDQLRVASKFGFTIPPTVVTNDGAHMRAFYRQFGGDIVNKALCGTLVDVDAATHTVYTHRVLPDDIAALGDFESVPCLLQARVEKAFELRVTVVGNEIFAAAIDSQKSDRTRDDWRRYDFERAKYTAFQLSSAVEQSCQAMMCHYQLDYAAFDLAVTPDGEYIFFEVNPNGQWLWVERLTGLPISRAIASRLLACQCP